MHRYIYTGCLILTLALSYLFYLYLQVEPDQTSLAKGEPPIFKGAKEAFKPSEIYNDWSHLIYKDEDGKNKTLGSLKGDWVVLNIWATWCAPCVEEMPTLDALHKDYKNKGLVVAPVSLDRAGVARVKEFYQQEGIDALPIMIGSMSQIMTEVAPKGLPITILLDSKGKEVGRLTGEAHWNSKEAKNLFDYYIK